MMPFLKQVIDQYIHKVEERMLLGKCFECMSLITKSVGRAAFRADADAIMQYMIQALQVQGLSNDDHIKEYVMAATERFITTMKSDFVPYIPRFLPLVLEKCTVTPREFDSEADGLDANDGLSMTISQADGKLKVLVVCTTQLEEVKSALECINKWVKVLGVEFLPFVQQTATALLPLFDFDMAEEIRDLSFETWGELVNVCRHAEGQVANELTMEWLCLGNAKVHLQ